MNNTLDRFGIKQITKVKTSENKSEEKILDLSEQLEHIEKSIDKLIEIRNNLKEKIEIIHNNNNINKIILDFEVINPGKFKDLNYDDIIVNGNLHKIQIKLSEINPNIIQIINKTRRSLKLSMIYQTNVVVIYNINFDLEKMDKDTNILKCSFYVTR